jgi:HEAT repeat protein
MCGERLAGSWPGKLPTTIEMNALINAAQDFQNRKDRIGAVIEMGESGDPRAVSPLIDCCRDRDAEVRRHAIDALSKLRSGRAVGALLERLRDRSERMENRKQAAAALATIRTYSAIAGLKDRLTDTDEDEVIRTFISGVMGKAGIR